MKQYNYPKLVLLTLMAFSLFTSPSCKKSNQPKTEEKKTDLTSNVSSIGEMVVPSGFNYQMNRKIRVSVPLTNAAFGSLKHKIEIYDGNPISNGNLLSAGAASYPMVYEKDLMIPSSLDVLYVVTHFPDGSSITTKVAATASEVTVMDLKKSNIELKKSAPASPDCNTGCTSTVTGNQNISLNTIGAVVCITGNFTGNIDLNRGTVRICGNAVIGNCSMNNNSTILIAAGASVSFSNFNINGNSATFSNWSNNVTIRSGFSPGGIVNNYGNMFVTNDFNVNGSAVITNEGTLTIGGAFNNNKTVVNNGRISVSGSFAQNGGASFTNSCNLTVGGDANLNNALTNNGYISVNLRTTINGGGELNMTNGAMLKTANLTANGTINGTGATSLVRVSGNTTINGGGRINGTLQYCDLNGIETNTGTISGTVSQACNLYLPVTSCNPDGNGVLAIPDTDGDGANDNIDEYPANKDLAFNNYYPNDKETATAGFEDLWPSKGDYDMNDLVIDFRHNFITNASNEIVKYEGFYRLRASGGSQKIAFCMGLPIKADVISEVTGAKSEDGHEKVVFQIFDDSKKELGGWNTVMNQAKVDFKEYNVSFDVKTPIAMKDFGEVGPCDPFIWVNEANKGRGFEVHLPGNAPTKYADQQWFGYADDDSNVDKAKYYLSKTNLPWAFVVPTNFDYCVELSMTGEKQAPDITQVYLHFAQWAQSAGEIYKDWYLDAEGFRNKDFIYSK